MIKFHNSSFYGGCISNYISNSLILCYISFNNPYLCLSLKNLFPNHLILWRKELETFAPNTDYILYKELFL